MIKLLSKRNTLGRLLVAAAVVALCLSFIGNLGQNFAQNPDTPRSFGTNVKIVLDTIPAAIKVFRAKPRASAGSASWVLTIAETLGALVTFSAVLALLWLVLKEQVERFRISLLRRHTIVLGFGAQAKLFLKSKQRPRDAAVVVIDPKASGNIRDKVHAEGCFHFATTDEISVEKQVLSCRIKRADRLIVAGRDDQETFEIAKDLSESNLPFPSDVVVDIRDVALHQQLEQSQAFMQSLGSGLRLFNYPKAAAVDLISRTDFTQLCKAQNQPSVGLVLFGTTLEAAEVVTHFLRASPSVGVTRPSIVWVVKERAALLRLLSLNYAPLAKLIEGGDAGDPLAWCVDIQVVETTEMRAPYDPVVLASASAALPASPTALIVAEDEGALTKSNIQIAVALRQASRRMPEFGVPIFAFSAKKGAEEQFLMCRNHPSYNAPVSQKKLAKTDVLANVIEPFGRSDEVCAWGNLDTARERLAQQLHAEYLMDRLRENDPEAQRAASLQPWETLSETYKNANRRAADQMKVLRSAKEYLLKKHGQIGTAEIETLAALEHNAWRIDRELDGWQYSETRDNRRKDHPNLIPYAQLTDQIKEYDRAKVRATLN